MCHLYQSIIKRFAIFSFIFTVFFSSESLYANSKNGLLVLKELAGYHELLLKTPNQKIDTGKLIALLNQGNASEKKIFISAKSDAVRLANAKTAEERFEAYANLVEKLSKVLKRHDNIYFFYCPMVQKKWVANGAAIRNPYDENMRICGEKLK